MPHCFTIAPKMTLIDFRMCDMLTNSPGSTEGEKYNRNDTPECRNTSYVRVGDRCLVVGGCCLLLSVYFVVSAVSRLHLYPEDVLLRHGPLLWESCEFSFLL